MLTSVSDTYFFKEILSTVVIVGVGRDEIVFGTYEGTVGSMDLSTGKLRSARFKEVHDMIIHIELLDVDAAALFVQTKDGMLLTAKRSEDGSYQEASRKKTTIIGLSKCRLAQHAAGWRVVTTSVDDQRLTLYNIERDSLALSSIHDHYCVLEQVVKEDFEYASILAASENHTYEIVFVSETLSTVFFRFAADSCSMSCQKWRAVSSQEQYPLDLQMHRDRFYLVGPDSIASFVFTDLSIQKESREVPNEKDHKFNHICQVADDLSAFTTNKGAFGLIDTSKMKPVLRVCLSDSAATCMVADPATGTVLVSMKNKQIYKLNLNRFKKTGQ